MVFKELLLHLKKNWLFNLFIGGLSFLSLVFLFILLFFASQTRGQLTAMDDTFEGKEIFHLSHDMYEEEIFDFFEDPYSVERVKRFYYGTLRDNNAFQTIQVHIQPIEVSGENTENLVRIGGIELDLPLGLHIVHHPINAVRVNQEAWELFPMEIASGRSLTYEDFSTFDGGSIPVVLGSDFADLFQVGDTFEANYLFLPFDWEVVGILAENQIVFDLQENYFIDNYIVLPTMSFLTPTNREEEIFQMLYYTNTAFNTFLFVEDNPEAINYMRNTIHTAAEAVQIPYFFSGKDRAFIRLIEVGNLINENLAIVQTLFVSSAILIALIMVILTRIKYQRRKEIYQSLVLLGIPKSKQIQGILLENVTLFLLVISFALYFVFYRSGLMITPDTIVWLESEGISRISFFWEHFVYDPFSFYHINMQRMALYGLGLLFISCVYPIWKVQQLYVKGRKYND